MVATSEEFIPLVLGVLNKLQNALILWFVLNGANCSTLLSAIADLHRLGISRNRSGQFVINIFVNIDTLGRNADLACIVKACPKQLFRDLAHIGIGQNNRGVITAQFKRNAL